MLKKVATILFSFCVGFSVLIHAILPHHHHNEIPCFDPKAFYASVSEDDHCCPENNTCCSNSCHEGHHHSGEDEKSCVLDQLIIVSCSDQEKSVIPSVQDQFRLQIFFQMLCPDWISFDFLPPKQLGFLKQIPYLINFQTVLASSIRGLRAPPFLF